MAGVIQDFFTFVDGRIDAFATTKAAAVASLIEPTFVMAMGIYVFIMAFLYISGKVEEPLMEFVKRAFKIGFIGMIALDTAKYGSYFISTFTESPQALAAALTGNPNNLGQQLDQMFENGGSIAYDFWQAGGVTEPGPLLMGGLVMLVTIATVAYVAFLALLSKIATGILLGIGPVFIIGLLFNATNKFFESWIAQISNYGLVQVLTVSVNVFCLEAFDNRLTQLANNKTVELLDCMPIFFMAGISLLLLGQVTSLASGLAGGISLSSMGIGRLAMQTAAGAASKGAQFMAEPIKRRREARNRVEGQRAEERYRSSTHGRQLSMDRRNKELRQAAKERYAKRHKEGSVSNEKKEKPQQNRKTA